jgi:hypothetical protein
VVRAVWFLYFALPQISVVQGLILLVDTSFDDETHQHGFNLLYICACIFDL